MHLLLQMPPFFFLHFVIKYENSTIFVFSSLFMDLLYKYREQDKCITIQLRQ